LHTMKVCMAKIFLNNKSIHFFSTFLVWSSKLHKWDHHICNHLCLIFHLIYMLANFSIMKPYFNIVQYDQDSHEQPIDFHQTIYPFCYFHYFLVTYAFIWLTLDSLIIYVICFKTFFGIIYGAKSSPGKQRPTLTTGIAKSYPKVGEKDSPSYKN